MEPWGTLVLVRYLCKDFPVRNTEAIYYPEMTKCGPRPDLNFHTTCVCEENLSKAWEISGATGWVASDLLKILVILSDTTVTRSAIDREDQKPYSKSDEKGHISRSDQQT